MRITRTPEKQREHEADTAACLALLDQLGVSAARTIVQKVLLFDLGAEELARDVAAAVADIRAHLEANRADPGDTEIAVEAFHVALLREGKRMVVLSPEAAGLLQ